MDVTSEALEQAIRNTCCPISDMAEEERYRLAEAGLVLDGDFAFLPAGVELLDFEYLSRELQVAGVELDCLEIRGCVGSTNSLLLQRARQESIDMHAILAEAQISGRGRRGRNWISPVGQSISLSLGLRLHMPAKRAVAASLVVGIAVSNVLARNGVPNVELKWPNDILVNGCKIAGILIEMVGVGPSVELVVGVGINIRSASFLRQRIDQAVSDVSEHVKSVSRNAIAAHTIISALKCLREFEEKGFGHFEENWKERDVFAGKAVCVTTPKRTLNGIARGIDSDGALILESEGASHRIIGGEVSLRLGA